MKSRDAEELNESVRLLRRFLRRWHGGLTNGAPVKREALAELRRLGGRTCDLAEAAMKSGATMDWRDVDAEPDRDAADLDFDPVSYDAPTWRAPNADRSKAKPTVGPLTRRSATDAGKAKAPTGYENVWYAQTSHLRSIREEAGR